MQMTGAEMVIAALQQENVDVIFGYPGGAALPLYDALFQTSLRHILTRHEQGAAHAADGYARVTGKPGVVLATSGPGATNLVTGIANAFMDSVPMVFITSQVATNLLGTDAFQEADITGITMPITKYNYLIKDVAELGETIAEAFSIAGSGRPGPVLIDIPKDVFMAQAEFDYSPRSRESVQVRGHYGQINRAVKALARSSRPVIYAGGGILSSGAEHLLCRLAEAASIPAVTTLMGMGTFPADHPLFLGMPGMHGTVAANMALSQADLILAVGVRFDDRVTGDPKRFATGAKIIHIDIDPAEIGKNVPVHIPIVGDAAAVVTEMLQHLQPPECSSWVKQVDSWRQQQPSPAPSGNGLKPQQVISLLGEMTQGEAIVTTDVGQHQMWAAQIYPCRHSRSFITSGGLGTMGFGLPAAIGAQIGQPGRQVICITGDGSFQMNLQELATIVQERLPIKIILINNGFLGMVRQWQEFFFDRRYSYTRLQSSPDFVRLAQAYGLQGSRVSEIQELPLVLEQALKAEGPVLVECKVAAEENVLPMVAPNDAIYNMIGGIPDAPRSGRAGRK